MKRHLIIPSLRIIPSLWRRIGTIASLSLLLGLLIHPAVLAQRSALSFNPNRAGVSQSVISVSPSITAQIPSSIDARISRLENDNLALRSRLSQLESQLSRLSQSAGVEPLPTPTYEGSSSIPISSLAEDPVFERLATLVIELRERIIALEEQAALRPVQ